MNCRSCGEPIRFVTMKTGGAMPLDIIPKKFIQVDERGIGRVVEGYISHFVTCPDADRHRKKKGGKK
jgi:hypothetical protein